MSRIIDIDATKGLVSAVEASDQSYFPLIVGSSGAVAYTATADLYLTSSTGFQAFRVGNIMKISLNLTCNTGYSLSTGTSGAIGSITLATGTGLIVPASQFNPIVGNGFAVNGNANSAVPIGAALTPDGSNTRKIDLTLINFSSRNLRGHASTPDLLSINFDVLVK